ncbi:NADPH-dependent oxidoreductase [Bacteroides sp.]
MVFLFISLQKKEMIDTVKNRRTIRKYQQKDISCNLLNDLLETSFRASTMGGMQLYSVVVTRDAEKKAQLSPAHFNQPMVKGAPVVLTFCADFNRFSKWCKERDAEPSYNNLMSFLNAAMDTLLVAQTFCTLAEEAGLGICYLGTTTYNPQMIIDALGLPELVFPITTVTVGYPAEEPKQVDRLPMEGLIHEEEYHDYSTEDINKLYAYKESLDENKEFIKENGKETLAQVFTDVRYTKKDNEFMSENLMKVLGRQGFI